MRVRSGRHSSAAKIGGSAARAVPTAVRAVPTAAGECLSAEKLEGWAVK